MRPLNPARLARTLLAIALFSGLAHCAKLIDNIRSLNKEVARQYTRPVVSSFGAAMNGGWFQQAPPPSTLGFDLGINVVGMGGLLFDAPENFSVTGATRFDGRGAGALVDSLMGALENRSQRFAALDPSVKQAVRDTLVGPTVIGSKRDSVKVRIPTGSIPLFVPAPAGGGDGFDTTIELTEGVVALPVTGALEDLPFMPMAAPQLMVGTLFGTQAAFRWLPPIELSSDVGELSLFGWGIQHNPGVWFPTPLPVDFTLGFYNQYLWIGDFFSSQAWSGGVNVSKRFGPRWLSFTPYGGAFLERSMVQIDYDYTVLLPAGEVKRHLRYRQNGENDYRFALGSSFRLAVLNLSVDYNFAKYPSVTTALGVML